MERLPELDDAWKERMAEAEAAGQCLQYIGRMEEGRLSVQIRRIEQGSPFARLDGSNNMVAYTTERYLDNPLVVQGPGRRSAGDRRRYFGRSYQGGGAGGLMAGRTNIQHR